LYSKCSQDFNAASKIWFSSAARPAAIELDGADRETIVQDDLSLLEAEIL
jgi:hypothetical protein